MTTAASRLVNDNDTAGKARENSSAARATKQPLLRRKTRILSEAPNNREKACHKVRHEYSQRLTKLKARTRVTALML
ncbi:MAG: hypothetical protein WB621_00150, partial [Candidatus Acidiferrales bacterium]